MMLLVLVVAVFALPPFLVGTTSHDLLVPRVDIICEMFTFSPRVVAIKSHELVDYIARTVTTGSTFEGIEPTATRKGSWQRVDHNKH